MRRPRRHDFACPTCGTTSTRLVETNDDDTSLEPEVCRQVLVAYDMALVDGVPTSTEISRTTCDGILTQNGNTVFTGYMKVITKGNGDFVDRERERLEKRQDEHWKKEGVHEAIETERSLFKKHGMEGSGGMR